MQENTTQEEDVIKTNISTEDTQELLVNEKLQEFIDFFRDIIIILALVFLVIRPYIGAPFQISGSSMEGSYHDGEFILVNKFSYADF